MVKNCTCLHCKYSLRTNVYSSSIQMNPASVCCVWYSVWWEIPATRYTTHTSYLLQQNARSKHGKRVKFFLFVSIIYYRHKVSAILNHKHSVANYDKMSLKFVFKTVYIGRIFVQFDLRATKMVQTQP